MQALGPPLENAYLRRWTPNSILHFQILFISSAYRCVLQLNMASKKIPDTQDGPAKVPVYDKMGAIFSSRTVAKCCAYLQPHIKSTSRILDVGCGPGSITIDLARLVPQGHVVGVDISPESVAQARSLAQSQGVTNVEFMQSDAHAIRALGDESFDIVHSHMVLMHLSDPVAALREMRRLVRTGGIVAARDSATTIIVPEKPALAKQKQIYDRISSDRGAHIDGGKYTHGWAHEAGFAWDKIETSCGAWEYSGAAGRRAFAEGAKNSMRVIAVGGGYATDAEIDEIGVGWEEWADNEDARFMSLDGQILCFK
jgi:ubiquinone/menaquinone biosynthesis C-methylase UbiE